MKIWTGRYANPNVATMDAAKVRITRYPPRFTLRYKIADNIPELAPSRELFKVNDRDIFSPAYFHQLDDLGIDWIKARLDRASQSVGGKDLVLLCFERVDQGRDWCHRLVLAEWIKGVSGEIWEEVDEPESAGSRISHSFSL
jgi:hypothetical protein